MTLRLLTAFLLLQQVAIVAGQFNCDCLNGDVPIVEHFQIIQSPPDTCPQNCVWKVSASADDQRVELVVQQVDAAITLTVLDGPDEDSSPPISNCSGRYMIVKTDSKFGMIKNGNNLMMRVSSVAQNLNGGNGSNSDHDHIWYYIGEAVEYTLLLILIIIGTVLVYTYIRERRIRRNDPRDEQGDHHEDHHERHHDSLECYHTKTAVIGRNKERFMSRPFIMSHHTSPV